MLGLHFLHLNFDIFMAAHHTHHRSQNFENSLNNITVEKVSD